MTLRDGWIGVAGDIDTVRGFENRPWWCIPNTAQKGDILLMYCPSSVNLKDQGIFAMCTVEEPPTENNEKNYYCSGFGKHLGLGQLFYAELKFNKRFKNTLKAREIKNHSEIINAEFVRKNFQGTIFRVSSKILYRLIDILEEKNP